MKDIGMLDPEKELKKLEKEKKRDSAMRKYVRELFKPRY